MVIGFCGPTGSGKDAASAYLAHARRARRFKHSDRLRTRLRANGVAEIPANMSRLFEANAGVLGYAWLAREVLEEIRAYRESFRVADASETPDPGPVVINGIRNVDEVVLYRGAFGGDFRLVALDASEEVRYRRVRNRGERPNEVNMSREAFREIERLESHTGEAAVMAMADVTVQNEFLLLTSFHDQISALL